MPPTTTEIYTGAPHTLADFLRTSFLNLAGVFLLAILTDGELSRHDLAWKKKADALGGTYCEEKIWLPRVLERLVQGRAKSSDCLKRGWLIMLDPPMPLILAALCAFAAVLWKLYDMQRQRYRYFTRLFLGWLVPTGISAGVVFGWRGWETAVLMQVPLAVYEGLAFSAISAILRAARVAYLVQKAKMEQGKEDVEKAEVGKGEEHGESEKMM